MHAPFAALTGSALALSLIACGPPPPKAPEFDDGPLAGVVGGEEWEVQGGATNDFLSDEDGFFTELFGTAEEDNCAAFAPPSPTLLITLPIPGDQSCETDDDCAFQPCVSGTCEGPPIFRFNLNRNMTFVVEDEEGEIENLVATRGAVRIDEIGDDQISGAITARFDDDNDISGEFTVEICE